MLTVNKRRLQFSQTFDEHIQKHLIEYCLYIISSLPFLYYYHQDKGTKTGNFSITTDSYLNSVSPIAT